MAGLGDPFLAGALPLLQYGLRGIKPSPDQTPRQPRLLITPAILRLLVDAILTTLSYGPLVVLDFLVS